MKLKEEMMVMVLYLLFEQQSFLLSRKHLVVTWTWKNEEEEMKMLILTIAKLDFLVAAIDQQLVSLHCLVVMVVIS
jgi:hypothetical protein